MSKIRSMTSWFSGIFLAMAVAGCSSDTNWQTYGKIADDSVITSEVKAQLANDPAFRTTRFEVESFRGVVLVSGKVASRQDSRKAAKIVKSVYGVNSVKNSIVVTSTTGTGRFVGTGTRTPTTEMNENHLKGEIASW